MSVNDKVVYGQNGPGDIETIIAEIESETISAKQRLSKLKREAFGFHETLFKPRPYPAAKSDPGPLDSPRSAASSDPDRPVKGRPDQD